MTMKAPKVNPPSTRWGILNNMKPPEVVQGHEWPMAILDADDLIGQTYLAYPDNEGVRWQMKIIKLIT